jgi:2-polyprenyl-6-methoxyphenol hydroxylase-like FAD-dependent oxidoreductase
MRQPITRAIAIIGGGPGGLTLARLLQMNGGDVRVYERDADRAARVQGATLDLHEESGLRALAAAGLMGAFRANYRPGADKLIIMDRQGRTLLDEFSSEDLGPERPEIDRGPLRELLLDSLAAGTVVWGSQFQSLTPEADSLRLTFADGTSVLADIVIGADGANSRLRAYVTSIKPVYSGIIVVEGSIRDAAAMTPQIHRRLGIGKICALGDERTLFVIAKGDGSLTFYTSHRAPEEWPNTGGLDFTDTAAVQHWFHEEFHGWSDLWDELFQNADLPFIPRPQYAMPLDPAWPSQPNLTLLGDAAHVMPPYSGEGVNMAMLDALELTECLTSRDYLDMAAAIAAYETAMRSRAAEAMQMTLENTAIFHSRDAIPRMVAQFASHHAAPAASAVRTITSNNRGPE